jgi:hypothetical protein
LEQVTCENDQSSGFCRQNRNMPVTGWILGMPDCAGKEVHECFTLGNNRNHISQRSALRMKGVSHQRCAYIGVRVTSSPGISSISDSDLNLFEGLKNRHVIVATTK